jgi:hypothetical protein
MVVQGSMIYIVMPVVAVLALVVLCGLPFAGSRESGESRSGGGHPRELGSGGHVPDRTVAPDARGRDVIGPG